MTTVDEKQRELDALQTAFDDYIASSRELEEELDAELTKCQNELIKAEAYNAALSAQLANTQPQMNSLEARVSSLAAQLSSESQRRVSAEMKSEEAENRLRESEGALAAVRSSEVRKLREENEDLCERLAFVEGEADDYRNELNTERERHREEVEELRGDVNVLTTKLRQREEELESLKVDLSYIGNISVEEKGRGGGDDDDDEIFDATPTPAAEALPGAELSGATRDEREEYIKTLEDELELVTEQLIESETRLSQTQAELEEALVEAERKTHNQAENGVMNGSSAMVSDAVDSETNTRLSEKNYELESALKRIEEENVSLREESKRLREELELVLEELALSKEELEAHDEDRRERTLEFDLERKSHNEEVAVLRSQIEKFSSEERYRDIHSKSMEDALMESKGETQALREEVERLEVALRNSKEDREVLQDEMENLKTAFDETSNRERAETTGQNQALEELLATRSTEIGNLLLQVCELKEEVTRLTNANESMGKMLKDAEDNVMNHQTELERQRTHVASASASSSRELEDARGAVYSLEGLLETARKELDEQKNEVALVRSSSQETILHVQSELAIAQEELARMRSRLMEAEKDRSKQDAESRAATASSLQAECNRLEDQNRMSMSMIRHLETTKTAIVAWSDCIDEKENDPVSDLIGMYDNNIDDILQSNDPEIISKEVRAMAKKMSAQKSHNAELLTRILKLQGNIQVCCRIRPMTAGESRQGLHEVAQSLSETEVGCFDERTRSWKSYAFDKVWGPESRQKDVFQDVEPLALSVIDGYNACIFAYGQTGSGKTFTMEGSKINSQYGISQRTIQKIFSLLQDKAHQHQRNNQDRESSPQFDYKIQVGMLEIYNDEVYDLLDSELSSGSTGITRKKTLDIRLSAENTVEVPGLVKESVSTVNEVLNVLDRGNSNRATASTNLNEHSSRSHMVLRVEVISGLGEAINTGTLYLVDLAGSERVRKSEVEGKELKEAQHINKSLSALGNVMEALDRKASHIPYRDSKLTYLLQNSLGGNSRTMMVVTVCPHNNSYDETTYALKFATRVRRINLGSAQKNVRAKNLEETVKNLISEMQLLSKAKERSESQLLSLKREKERVEEKLSAASHSRANSKEEMRNLTILRQANDDITSRWQKERIVREEKAAELGKVQDELQRVQVDLRNLKRDKDSLQRQNELKDGEICKLKKDLQSMKEQLNGEKIRLRRSLVMQSRIPAPTRSPYDSATNRKTLPSQKTVGLKPPSSRKNGTARETDQASLVDTTERIEKDPNHVSRIRFRVLKMLQEHDPTKVAKIDIVMAKFEGRETELLEKMIARYEGGTDETKSLTSTAEASESNISSSDGKPKSRQDKSLEKHMARMKMIRAAAGKD
ncbi:hypothetical protein ACHAW5_006080 [Stephanodiscus triporus]|uniref:Kinesin motor domain-containing protein n=1 Tax=Stephanodiscus triporus TaxID=2934178 RepID=A0ABD3QUM7_9STRA